jgi:hypothetical protein
MLDPLSHVIKHVLFVAVAVISLRFRRWSSFVVTVVVTVVVIRAGIATGEDLLAIT